MPFSSGIDADFVGIVTDFVGIDAAFLASLPLTQVQEGRRLRADPYLDRGVTLRCHNGEGNPGTGTPDVCEASSVAARLPPNVGPGANPHFSPWEQKSRRSMLLS
jgi:hypothetical protein